MGAKYRHLSPKEIKTLEAQGCSCDDWTQVTVAGRFNPQRIKSTHFSGTVTLGVFDKKVTLFGGITKRIGISYATIHNCSIGNNVYINKISNHIANYVIENDVTIENVDIIAVNKRCSFGNGTPVKVLVESGGREIPIYDFLSAQVAYLIAFYRHRTDIIKKLNKIIAEYTESVSATKGLIAQGARIINSRIIKNMKVGPYAYIEGINKIENGSINSCKEDPVYIGSGVIASNFIVASGSTITDGAILSNCFVGQGCVLSKQYSAENSVFFANCGGYHGEAWSIFAGPYTVTFHKGTLLISSLVSFNNAGSGSNQSNHMYKLGPVHQGIVERGSKTASDSYILWPARVGPFTLVMGRHFRNSDTSDLPYSYLIEHEDESILVPGVNLRSVGTIRDARKWPKRDRRKDPCKLDLINFNLLSPYSIQRMIKGCEILRHLRATSGETSDNFVYNGVKIRKHSLEKGIEFYEMGIIKLLGNTLLNRLKNRDFSTIEEVRERLKSTSSIGTGKWIDVAGMFAPEEAVKLLLDDIEKGALVSLEDVHKRFESIHRSYQTFGWSWAVDILQERLHKTMDKITARDIISIIKKWKNSVIKLDKLLIKDAKKEFNINAHIGYGLDGDVETMEKDFEAVHGVFEKNSFVKEIENHIEKKSKLGDDMIEKMKKILKR